METIVKDLSTLTGLVAPWLAILLSIILTIWFKDFATNLSRGYMFYRSKDFRNGDNVILDGMKARIISTGIRKTVFEVEYENYATWRYIANHRIDYIKLEKILK